MKNTLLIAVAVALSTAVNAQDIRQKDVPSVVLNALQTLHSNAEDIEWEREGDLYKAEFEVNRKDHDIWIDADGNVKKHKVEATDADLPQAVKDKIKSEYANFRIDDVDKIEIEGKTYYQVELDGKPSDKEIIFLPDGAVQESIK